MATELKKQLVVQDHEGNFHVWSKEEYDGYIRAAVKVGAGSGVRIVTHFEGTESLLDESPPTVSESVEDENLWAANLWTVLSELVELKDIKDSRGKTENYNVRQPIAWKLARQLTEKYKADNPLKLSLPSAPLPVDIVERLREANPYKYNGYKGIWNKACNKLQEILPHQFVTPDNQILVTALEWYADPGNYMFDDIQLATAYVNDNLANKAKIALGKFRSSTQTDKEEIK